MSQQNDYTLSAGRNGLDKVTLRAPDGARAEIYLHGAQVTSWIAADGVERLFLSERSDFLPGTAIRGGVPVIFPQFNDRGPLIKHGFARRMEWNFRGAGQEGAEMVGRFELRDQAATRQAWPKAFRLEMEVRLGGESLALRLTVQNPGPETLDFTGGLHTYLRVAELREVEVAGLQGQEFVDTTTTPPTKGRQAEAVLSFSAEVDRIYPAAPEEVILREHERRLRVEKQGFADLVVWNPGREKGIAMQDLGVEGYRRFVCIEAAAVERAIPLGPGESWSGLQQLSVL